MPFALWCAVRWLMIALFLAACGGEEIGSLAPDAGSGPLDAQASDLGSADLGTPDSGDTDLGPSIFDPWWEMGAPPPPAPVVGRWGAVTIYVPEEERVIIHGGSQYPDPTSGELWSYDRGTQTWTELFSVDPPEPRYCHCGVYLPDSREFLLINGRNDRGPLPAAAWTLSLDTLAWTPVNGDLPPGVIGCHAIYDPIRKRVIVFGGANRTGMSNQTHIYDPSSRTFSRVLTQNSPPMRRDGMFIYDPASDKFWLHGGQVPGGHLEDTWTFDGADWREELIPGPLPPSRRWAAHALDARGRWVMFGGTNEAENFQDLWVMNLSEPGWEALNLANPPDGRAGAAYIWFPEDDFLWIFGGLDVPFLRSLTDGWNLTLSR